MTRPSARRSRTSQVATRSPIVGRRAFALGLSTAALPGVPGGATGCGARAAAEQTERPPKKAETNGPGDDERAELLSAEAAATLETLEREVGGRLGAFALDTASGRSFGRRIDERFAMCSTFKWLLAAAVLERADRGELALHERVSFGEADLLEYAPVTRAHAPEGELSVEELARAAVVVSDNTAANLLLRKVGGPSGLTQFARRLEDDVTRLDRNEPSLNENAPGDARDTTSPRAMVQLARAVLCGSALSAPRRALLIDWLCASETGKERVCAGLPADWRTGDKTGTGARGAVNDVAITWPPGREPLLVAVYLSDSGASLDELNRIHADVARIVARTLG